MMTSHVRKTCDLLALVGALGACLIHPSPAVAQESITLERMGAVRWARPEEIAPAREVGSPASVGDQSSLESQAADRIDDDRACQVAQADGPWPAVMNRRATRLSNGAARGKAC